MIQRMNLRTWRNKHGLTQAEAGQVLGFAQGVVANLENRRRHPRPATMRIIKERTGGQVAEADWYADPEPAPVSRPDNTVQDQHSEAAHG